MTTCVKLPKSGMGIEEGTAVRWLKKVGDEVTKGEVLVEVETAKATQEIVAPVSGVLTRILLGEGQTGAVNTSIAVIEESDA